MRDARDHNKATDPLLLQLAGMVRRMAVSLTTKALWQIVGFRKSDGTQETRNAEPFTGIGFYSRPPSSGKPEAIVVMVGDANAPVVVATRDEKTRAASAGDLGADEAAIYNTLARAHVKSDGTVAVEPIIGSVLQPMIKGQTYRTGEDTMLTALSTFLVALAAYATGIKAVADPSNASTPALLTACTTMEAAIATFQAAAATYLSQVGKLGG